LHGRYQTRLRITPKKRREISITLKRAPLPPHDASKLAVQAIARAQPGRFRFAIAEGVQKYQEDQIKSNCGGLPCHKTDEAWDKVNTPGSIIDEMNRFAKRRTELNKHNGTWLDEIDYEDFGAVCRSVLGP
jgi:hypothetical protein